MMSRPSPAPRPPAPPLIGHLPAFHADRLAFLQRCARDHGDVVGLRLGPYRSVLLSHPDLVREVLTARQDRFHKSPVLRAARAVLGDGLLTSEGELHRRQRRLVQPAFHPRRIDAYAEVMGAYAERAADRWRAGAPVDVHAEMLRLTLAIAGKTLFDVDIEERESATFAAALDELLGLSYGPLMLVAGVARWLPLPAARRLRRSRARLDATIERIVRQRRAEGGDRGDLLSALLVADDGGGPRPDGRPPGTMSERQVRDEAMTLLLAGHETTASALTFAWHLLGRHPRAAARLAAEASAVLGGRPGAAGDVERLPYARAVLAEALRLYPPSWTMGRRALAEHEAAGRVVPRGAVVLMSQWVVHRDARWWAQPQRFAPERWSAPAPGRPRFAYFPFGGGSRACVGESFAWAEGALVLATIARRWRLRPLPGGPLALRPLVTLRPAGRVWMVPEQA